MNYLQAKAFKFDLAAIDWDTPERTARALKVAKTIGQAVEKAQIPTVIQERTALEFGCGTGLVSFFLKDQFAKIHLVDMSKGMIEVLNDKIENQGLSHFEGMVIDIFDENALSETYDVIYSSMVMHHIQDTKALIERLKTYLKPNGILCLVDLDLEDGSFHADEIGFDGHNGFDQEALKQLFIEIGFNHAESHTFFRAEKKRSCGVTPYSLFLAVAQLNP